MLHRLASLHRGNGTELRLFALAGSPAAVIMTLVQLRTITPMTPICR